MIIRSLRLFLIYILSLSLTYAPLLRADQLSLPSTDLIAPQVIHDPIKDPMKAGTSQTFSAMVKDNVAVQSVTLFYRTVGSKNYKRKPMTSQGSDTYSAIVDAAEMQEPGIEYYIQATDQAGNNLLHGYSFSPLVVTITASAIANTHVKEEAKEVSYTPKEESSNKWLWIGLGVLVVAAAAGGGGGGGGSSDSTATLTITTTEPTP